MFSSVAAATLALKVMATTLGDVSTALTGVAPAMSVVYAGVPFRMTGPSNVTVTVVLAAVAAVTLIGTVGCGLLTALFVRLRDARRLLSSEPAMGDSFGEML